jgi:membrane protein YqaA with SNARE-associated domain
MTASMVYNEDTITPEGYDVLRLELLKEWGAHLLEVFQGYGALGLVGLSLIDSGLMPLPEAIDVLVVTMSIQQPHLLPWYVLAATLGSVLGCVFLYFIAAEGGHAFLERRLGQQRSMRIRARFEKYEFVTLLITSMLPPPTPFKAFILTAGVVEVNPWKFAAAIGIGRLIRYGVEGYLAIRYGVAVLMWTKSHGLQLGLWVMAAAAAVALAFWLRSRWQPEART